MNRNQKRRIAMGSFIGIGLMVLVQPIVWADPLRAKEQGGVPYQAAPERAVAGVIQAVDTTDPTAVKVTLKTPQDQFLTIVVSPKETFLWQNDEVVLPSALQAGLFAQIRYEFQGQTAVANTVILNPKGGSDSPPHAEIARSPRPFSSSSGSEPEPASSQKPVPPPEPSPLQGD